MPGPTLSFGLPEEWADFHRRHPLFVERFPRLVKVLEMVFIREVRPRDLLDQNLFFLGDVCREDFMEILLLCGNGYGIGAQKLLRGMFERVLMARYLSIHPEKAQDFADFGAVNQHKLMVAILEVFGNDALAEEAVAQTRAAYQDFKNRGRDNWQPDYVTMAREVSTVSSVGKFVVQAYYLPLFQTHATVQSITSRIEETKEGNLAFDGGPRREVADDVLMTAHNLILDMLALQGNHFGIEPLKEAFDECVRDWLEIWEEKGTGTPKAADP